MKSQANMTPTKETHNVPVSEPKEMEICKLADKEFKVITLKKLNEMQENTNN